MKIESYACGALTAGTDDGVEVRNAINGESIGWVSIEDIDAPTFTGIKDYHHRWLP